MFARQLWSLLLITTVAASGTHGCSLRKTLTFCSANKIDHWNCGYRQVRWPYYISANRSAMCRMRTGHYVGIPTSRVSVFKLKPVFSLFSRMTQSRLAKLIISLTQLTSTIHVGDQSWLVLHGKQLLLSMIMIVIFKLKLLFAIWLFCRCNNVNILNCFLLVC